MIEIRCKFCHRLNAEVGDDTRGRLKMKCKKCLRWIDLELPMAESKEQRVEGKGKWQNDLALPFAYEAPR
jgi:phage FluMu protein Com